MRINYCLLLLLCCGCTTYGQSRWWTIALPQQKSISVTQIRQWVARNKPILSNSTFAIVATKPEFLAPQIGWIGNLRMFLGQYYSLGDASEKVALFLETPRAYSLVESRNGTFRVSGSRNLFDLPGGQGRILAVDAFTHTAYVRIPLMIEIEKGCSLLSLVRKQLGDGELEITASTDGWFPGGPALAVHSFWFGREVPPDADAWAHQKSLWCRGSSTPCDCRLF